MKRTPLKRKTPMKRGGFPRHPSHSLNVATGEQPKRRKGLRSRSRTNSNRHVNKAARDAYLEANQVDEIMTLFPQPDRNCYFLPNGGGGGHEKVGLSNSDHVHHVLWGQARRHDITANMIALSWITHQWVHEFKVDGMVLALEAKRRKGELDWKELKHISRMDVKGWLSGKRPVFDWVVPLWQSLITGESR